MPQETPAPSQTKTVLIAPPRRHSRKCTVCHHPFRHLIELSFLRWSSPSLIARRFGINDRATIYHHAHATHLFEFRQLISYKAPPSKQRDHELQTNPILIAATRALGPSTHDGPSNSPPPEMPSKRFPYRVFNSAPKMNRISIQAPVGIRKPIGQRINNLQNLKSHELQFSLSQKIAHQPAMSGAPRAGLRAARVRFSAAPPGGSESRHLWGLENGSACESVGYKSRKATNYTFHCKKSPVSG